MGYSRRNGEYKRKYGNRKMEGIRRLMGVKNGYWIWRKK